MFVCSVGSPGLLQDRGSPVERPQSSEILEQLLSQGIIPVGPPLEGGSGPGEASNVMVRVLAGASLNREE